MSVVIVTKNQYLVCAKIHHIVLHELKEYQDYRLTSGRYKTIIEKQFQISIIYSPEATNGGGGNNVNYNSRDERHECIVNLLGAVNAHRVYKDIIEQIREQMPDQKFLDKALEDLLTENDFEIIAEKEKFELIELEAPKNDRRPKKVRRARKAKRTSKKVLRKSKRRR